MQQNAPDGSAVEKEAVTTLESERRSLPWVIAAAVIPPVAAFALEVLFWNRDIRWSLFYVAIFVSSWIGGFYSGLSATVLSTALMWWFFTPPRHELIKLDPRAYFSAMAFIAIGFIISGLHRGLRLRTRQLAAALLDSRALARRLAEALDQLEKSQRFLQAILDYSPNGIVIKSLDGRYLVMNKGFESLSGVTGAEAIGKTDFDLFSRPVAERFHENDRRVLESRAPLVTEEQTGRNHGHIVLVSKFPLFDEHDNPFAVCAIWSDITERKHTEEALQQSTRNLRTAQRVAHVGSWRWDRRTLANSWSEELYEIFGQDPHSPPPQILQPESRLFTPETAAPLRDALETLLEKGDPCELDAEVVRPDGSRRWITVHAEPVRDENERIVGMDGTAADITHIKLLQRMREEWTSVIAHDLRQPIGVIAMAADFLPTLHNGTMTNDEQAFMKRIRSATSTLARMVDDLLDMSLLEARRLKLVQKWADPATLVTEAVDRLLHTVGKKRVRVSSPRNLPQVFVDPMRIGQVLGNLLTNAVKYGEKGHDILVRVDHVNGEIDISVTNHGKGIQPEELPRLFDRFTRTRSAHTSDVPGLGLGLYISKGVVEAHGGRLWAESVPGQTTSFHFSLPVQAVVREAAA